MRAIMASNSSRAGAACTALPSSRARATVAASRSPAATTPSYTSTPPGRSTRNASRNTASGQKSTLTLLLANTRSNVPSSSPAAARSSG